VERNVEEQSGGVKWSGVECSTVPLNRLYRIV
jgi:hypothetical protein